MADVSLRKVRKSFGGVEIIKGVDLDIANGEFCVFVGPSGCGKSTLLRMIAGLEDITSGELRIGGRDMKTVASAERGVAMVFQSYALYPHMTVRENIGFGLRMTGRPRAEIEKRTARGRRNAATRRAARPQAVRSSRAANGSASPSAAPSCASRACSFSTSRSPTSTRRCASRCASRSGKLHQSLGATMIYVTHDQVEAMTMADRIVVLNARRDRAGRLAARTLPPPAQPVCRRFHRFAEDELPAREGRFRRRSRAMTLALPGGGDDRAAGAGPPTATAAQ